MNAFQSNFPQDSARPAIVEPSIASVTHASGLTAIAESDAIAANPATSYDYAAAATLAILPTVTIAASSNRVRHACPSTSYRLESTIHRKCKSIKRW